MTWSVSTPPCPVQVHTPSAALWILHAGRRHHPPVLEAAGHAGLGAALGGDARAGAPAGPRPRTGVLRADGPLSERRARPRLPRRRLLGRGPAPGHRRARGGTRPAR